MPGSRDGSVAGPTHADTHVRCAQPPFIGKRSAAAGCADADAVVLGVAPGGSDAVAGADAVRVGVDTAVRECVTAELRVTVRALVADACAHARAASSASAAAATAATRPATDICPLQRGVLLHQRERMQGGEEEAANKAGCYCGLGELAEE